MSKLIITSGCGITLNAAPRVTLRQQQLTVPCDPARHVSLWGGSPTGQQSNESCHPDPRGGLLESHCLQARSQLSDHQRCCRSTDVTLQLFSFQTKFNSVAPADQIFSVHLFLVSHSLYYNIFLPSCFLAHLMVLWTLTPCFMNCSIESFLLPTLSSLVILNKVYAS